MSCQCRTNVGEADSDVKCRCDHFEHPVPPEIGSGLTHLPRQVADFGQFRRAMLRDLRRQPALQGWKARQEEDLGLMLLDMWAYLCDSLSFYDEVFAHEAYVGTARRRPSLRRLTALLGYQPGPAVASSVMLAAFADGRNTVNLPKGTAFRSAAFDGNAPQVFETEADTAIHPLTNKWQVLPKSPTMLTAANPASLHVRAQVELKPETWLLLTDRFSSSNHQTAWVTAVTAEKGLDGLTYHRLTFPSALKLPSGLAFERLQLSEATQKLALWTKGETAISGNRIALDAQYRHLRTGDLVVLEHLGEAKWFRIDSVRDVSRKQSPDTTVTISGSNVKIPGVTVPVTELSLHTNVPWADWHKDHITVMTAFRSVGQVTALPVGTLPDTVSHIEVQKSEQPFEDVQPRDFIVRDLNGRSTAFSGEMDFQNRRIVVGQYADWSPALTLPAEVMGNLVRATRGEQVKNEILGSGNAAQPSQTFKLKKKPLTYLSVPEAGTDTGLKNTLEVYVDGIKWREVSTFYGQKADAQVYIVRQNDDGDSIVIFGDGIRGQRPVTGQDNIVAHYRFGAGQAAPPAGGITQIGKPVKNVSRVANPIAASGGADAESAENLRTNAPKSALLLGRAVSLADMEAVALAFPGVRAAQADWRWNSERQGTVAHVFYIGGAETKTPLSTRLRSLCDPSITIAVEQAEAVPVDLQIDVEVDARYIETDVLAALHDHLFAPPSGILTSEKIGIGKPVFRSFLFAKALEVAGVVSVRSLLWNGMPFSTFGLKPGTGKYFEISAHGPI